MLLLYYDQQRQIAVEDTEKATECDTEVPWEYC